MARTHGKASTYKTGCRCPECTQANTTEQREAIARRTGRTPPAHGNSTYSNWGCRCEICKAAHAAVVKAFHDRNKGKEPPEHGTMNAYQHYSCRCDECKQVAQDYRLARKELDEV